MSPEALDCRLAPSAQSGFEFVGVHTLVIPDFILRAGDDFALVENKFAGPEAMTVLGPDAACSASSVRSIQ